MKLPSFATSGVLLLAFGLPLSIRALLLMYDPTTTTQVWMLREFAAGLSLACWGVAMILSPRWSRLWWPLMTLANEPDG